MSVGMGTEKSERIPGERIDVTFGFDVNYAMHAAAVIASVHRYGKGSTFRFIILHEGVGAELQKEIEGVAPGDAFVWIEVGDDDVPQFEARRHLTRSTLYRLGLETLAPADCKRVIYLDADITVIGDVSELWRTDLKGAAIGAAVDSYLSLDYDGGPPFHEQWDLPKGDYFNAGILLIDLEKVRAGKLFARTIEFVATHDHDLPFNDQDALNYVFAGNWRRLDVIWNLQRPQAVQWQAPTLPKELQLGDQRPMIIHYTGPEKPWLSTGYHPWSWTYWESLGHTPFVQKVAMKQGVSRLQRLKLWFRWIRRKPKLAVLEGDAPLAALR